VPLAALGERPLVSVLIPNKDYGRFLPDALESVSAQTYTHWQVIVCDDGSSDDSRDVVDAFAAQDDRYSLVAHEGTRGQAAAFNSAFERADGQIISFLDADDLFLPHKIESIVDAFRRSPAGLVVHAMTLTDAEGREIQRIPAFTRFERGWIAPRVIARGGRWRWVPTSGVCLRREVAELVFPMPAQGYLSSADTYFLVLAPLLTPVEALDEPLGRYRRHGGNAYARTHVDLERIPRNIDNLTVSAERVSERLAELGRDARVDVESNLKFQELRLQRDLLAGTPRRALWPRLRRVIGSIRDDDMYGATQRLWAPMMYVMAFVLPVAARAWWLSLSLSASRPKELARRLVTSARGVGRA
jgi:glycosyltransferase involved in cell wall biosynthesis